MKSPSEWEKHRKLLSFCRPVCLIRASASHGESCLDKTKMWAVITWFSHIYDVCQKPCYTVMWREKMKSLGGISLKYSLHTLQHWTKSLFKEVNKMLKSSHCLCLTRTWNILEMPWFSDSFPQIVFCLFQLWILLFVFITVIFVRSIYKWCVLSWFQVNLSNFLITERRFFCKVDKSVAKAVIECRTTANHPRVIWVN